MLALATESNAPSAANSEPDCSEPMESEMVMENGTDNKNLDENDETERDIVMSAFEADADDPLIVIKSVIKWNEGLGYLPGSVCRFKLDADGDLLLADDFREVQFCKRQKLLTTNVLNDDEDFNDILRCKNCNSYGFKDEFLKGGAYCKDCANLNPFFKMLKQLSLLYDNNNKAAIKFLMDDSNDANSFDSFHNYSFAIFEEEYFQAMMSVPAEVHEKCKQLIQFGNNVFNPFDIPSWNYDQVEQFVFRLTECAQTSQVFADQRIDGQSFLMLKNDDLTDLLNIKLGPAVKIYSCISAIRALVVDGPQ